MDPTTAVLDFWFGPLTLDGRAHAELAARWWAKDPEFDREVRERFAAVHAQLNAGGRPSWTYSPRGLLACVLVLDQFSRNMFRGTPGMFSADEQALALAFEGIALGYDRKLRFAERTFLYLPLMHAERLDVQNRCVDLFDRFRAEQVGEHAEELQRQLKFAMAHRDLIKRFGRFPHRNAWLERETTPEERDFLTQPGMSQF
ncbi:MAG TPA: DUF924 family protein [Polyangiaceae bacterium]|nr:DUF924 family protein [Polyangiaceae bacterium]